MTNKPQVATCNECPSTIWRTVLAATIVLVGYMPSIDADNMRCGGRVITDGENPGATMAEVLSICGQPYDEHGNKWLYVKGNRVYRVYFNINDEVRRITTEIVR